jgi:hypothetical protein
VRKWERVWLVGVRVVAVVARVVGVIKLPNVISHFRMRNWRLKVKCECWWLRL